METSNTNRNIWIFGGTGYIGSALVNHLAADSRNRLHLLIHKRTPYRYLEPFTTINSSLSGFDPFWLERYPPDVIFHLARPGAGRNITRFIRSNLGRRANTRMVRIMKGLEKKPAVVYVSGSLMYGTRGADDPAFEDSPLQPGSYAAHYIRNEQPWLQAQAAGLPDVRFARPGWIVGPGSWFRQFFWEPYKQTGIVPCYGTGDHPMSLIHIEDCAAMVDALALHGQKGSNLNVFSGPVITHREFCTMMAEILHTTIMEVPYDQMIKSYGKTTATALISSTPMGTLYPRVHEKARIKYPGPREILSHVCGLLENI